jgi:hypothetical protein
MHAAVQADPSLSHIWAGNRSTGPRLSACVGSMGAFRRALVEWVGPAGDALSTRGPISVFPCTSSTCSY